MDQGRWGCRDNGANNLGAQGDLKANKGQSTGRTTSLAQRVMDFVAQNNPDQPTRIDRRLVQAFRNAANAQRKYKMSAYMVVKKAKSAGLEIADDCRCYLP